MKDDTKLILAVVSLMIGMSLMISATLLMDTNKKGTDVPCVDGFHHEIQGLTCTFYEYNGNVITFWVLSLIFLFVIPIIISIL